MPMILDDDVIQALSADPGWPLIRGGSGEVDRMSDPVANEIPGCRVPWECFGHLACRPRSYGIDGNGKVYQLAPVELKITRI